MLADFAPIFLFRANDNILFEAGFDVTLQNQQYRFERPNPMAAVQPSVSLSFAQLDYLLNDYVTVVAGYMVLPLGTYSERAAGWLNKIPDDPLARRFPAGQWCGRPVAGRCADRTVGTDAHLFRLWRQRAVVNGSEPRRLLAIDLDLGGNVGGCTTPNLHGNPSGGGRIGWFYPWKAHYDIELGVSGQSGVWDNAGNRLWSAAVVDAAMHIGPYFEVKGEYINTWVANRRRRHHPAAMAGGFRQATNWRD